MNYNTKYYIKLREEKEHKGENKDGNNNLQDVDSNSSASYDFEYNKDNT